MYASYAVWTAVACPGTRATRTSRAACATAASADASDGARHRRRERLEALPRLRRRRRTSRREPCRRGRCCFPAAGLRRSRPRRRRSSRRRRSRPTGRPTSTTYPPAPGPALRQDERRREDESDLHCFSCVHWTCSFSVSLDVVTVPALAQRRDRHRFGVGRRNRRSHRRAEPVGPAHERDEIALQRIACDALERREGLQRRPVPEPEERRRTPRPTGT